MQFTDKDGPQTEQEDDATMVGVMSDENKRLWVVMTRISADGKKRAVALKAKVAHEAADAIAAGKGLDFNAVMGSHQDEIDAINRLSVEHDTINTVMWESIRVQYPVVATKPEIGVYKGWQIGWRNKTEDEMPAAPGSLFGSGIGISLPKSLARQLGLI
ncbi:MAG: hypothetical protein PHV93_00810 [Candidatus Pacebacteria bacterium]|nr:hypothetical protein [Candidatus Paceibacterota bacterium]